MARYRLILAALLAGGPVSAGPVAAQLIERGTFRIWVDGTEVGSEQFTIQRQGTGDDQTTEARSIVSMRDGRRLETFLEVVGPQLTLVRYAAVETGPDTMSVTLSRTGDRLRTRTTTDWGLRVRGYRARPGTFVLDEWVAHHYFVLGGLAGEESAGRRLYVFSRVSAGIEPVEVAASAPESIELEGERIEATRIDFGSGEAAGSVWFDGSGRLVRVSLPGRGFVAERSI